MLSEHDAMPCVRELCHEKIQKAHKKSRFALT